MKGKKSGFLLAFSVKLNFLHTNFEVLGILCIRKIKPQVLKLNLHTPAAKHRRSI